MANVRLNDDERLIKSSRFTFRKPGGVLPKFGTLFLTTQRFVIHKITFWHVMLFGFFALFLCKGSYAFAIPLSQITEFARDKFALNRNVMTIKCADGLCYTFFFQQPFEEWSQALSHVLQTELGKNFVNQEGNVWSPVQ